MCLSKITQVFTEPQEEERDAWKVFDSNQRDELKFPFYHLAYSQFVQRGEWLKAHPCTESTSDGRLYQTGFHCFPDKKDALWYAGVSCSLVLKIRVRGLKIIGTETLSTAMGKYTLKTWVVCEIFVPK